MDRVGVYICLEALKYYENIKVAFVVEEECGCLGSKAITMDFFKDAMFVFQADRKGDNEVIYNSNSVDMMGDEFKAFIKPIMDDYDYEFGVGTMTDIGTLSTRGLGLIGMNIGCGYFEPHSKDEKVCLSAVENCMNLLFHITDKCLIENKQLEFVPPKKVYPQYSQGTGYYGSNYGKYNYDDPDYDGYDDYNGYKPNYNKKVETKEEAKARIRSRRLNKDELDFLKDSSSPEYWETFKTKINDTDGTAVSGN